MPADNTVTQRQLKPDNLGEYSGIGTIILTGIMSATSIRGDGSLLTGVSAGKFVSDSGYCYQYSCWCSDQLLMTKTD